MNWKSTTLTKAAGLTIAVLFLFNTVVSGDVFARDCQGVCCSATATASHAAALASWVPTKACCGGSSGCCDLYPTPAGFVRLFPAVSQVPDCSPTMRSCGANVNTAFFALPYGHGQPSGLEQILPTTPTYLRVLCLLI